MIREDAAGTTLMGCPSTSGASRSVPTSRVHDVGGLDQNTLHIVYLVDELNLVWSEASEEGGLFPDAELGENRVE